MKFTKHNDKSEILKRGGLDLPPIFFHIDFKNSSIDLILFFYERYGLCGYGKNIEKVSERSKINFLELLI